MKTSIALVAATTAGTVSTAVDMSQITGDWTLTGNASLTPGSHALVSLQTSLDNFSSDIQTVAVYDVLPGINVGNASIPAVWGYLMPSARFGAASCKARLAVQSIGGSSSVSVSLVVLS